MKVYVLTHEPYHDNSTVMGVYSSLEKAMAAELGPWQREGFYVEEGRAVAQMENEEREEYLIREVEVDG